MKAVSPKFAFGDIINLSFESNVNRIPVVAVIFGKFIYIEFFHSQLPEAIRT